jgi:hypothetical protein
MSTFTAAEVSVLSECYALLRDVARRAEVADLRCSESRPRNGGPRLRVGDPACGKSRTLASSRNGAEASKNANATGGEPAATVRASSGGRSASHGP